MAIQFPARFARADIETKIYIRKVNQSLIEFYESFISIYTNKCNYTNICYIFLY